MTRLVWVDECQNSHFGLKLLVGLGYLLRRGFANDYAQPTGNVALNCNLRT